VNTAAGHDTISGFKVFNQQLKLLPLFLLGTNQEKIKDDPHEKKRQQLQQISLGSSGLRSSGLLSQEKDCWMHTEPLTKVLPLDQGK
jgi:hypothetical protein